MSNTRKLEKINDQELNARLNAVRAMIRRTRKNNGDTSDAEVELCYIERESEIRSDGRNIHAEYDKEQKEIGRQLRREEEEAIREYLSYNRENEFLF